MTSKLHHASIGRERAVKDGEPTALLERLLDGGDDALPAFLNRGVRDLADRASIDGLCIPVQKPTAEQLTADQGESASTMQIRRDVLTCWRQLGDHRRAVRDITEVVDRERHVELSGHREQMKHGVRRSAGRRHRRDGVFERLTCHEATRPHVAAYELHDQLPRSSRGLALRRISGRD